MTELQSGTTSPLDSIRHASGTDIGRRREENQDSFSVLSLGGAKVFTVADGMGGVKGGAVASQLALSVFDQSLAGTELITVDVLSGIVTDVNARVHERGQMEPGLENMGTTLVSLIFVDDRLFIVNVGDSRAYRFRGGKWKQMTSDHTLIAELLKSGAIPPEQAENHPVSHMLTRSIGPTPEVEPDVDVCRDGPARGDVYLLCSDGLYNLVTPAEMLQIVSESSLDDAVQQLIRLANERGGTDNITVILAQLDDTYPHDPAEFPEEPPPEFSPAAAESAEVQEPAETAADVMNEDALGAKAASSLLETHSREALGVRRFLPGVLSLAVIVALFLVSVLWYGEPTQAGRGVIPTINPFAAELVPVAVRDLPIQAIAGSPELQLPRIEQERSAREVAVQRRAASISPADENLVRRRDAIVRRLVELEARIESFKRGTVDTWGDTGKAPGEAIPRLQRELDSVRLELDTATRRFSVWLGRKRRAESSNAVDLATEVAVASPLVREKKELFEKASWEYLNKVEEWRYNPNADLSREVASLASIRNQRMQDLVGVVRRAIDEEVGTSERQVSDLSWKRDDIQARIAAVERDASFIEALRNGNDAVRKQMRDELEHEREILSSELQAIERVLGH